MTRRIDRAEEDRMDKYYKQVSVVQDWTESVKDFVNDSAKMTENLSSYFCMEHEIKSYNSISEAMTRTLEGRQLNNFVEFMREK